MMMPKKKRKKKLDLLKSFKMNNLTKKISLKFSEVCCLWLFSLIYFIDQSIAQKGKRDKDEDEEGDEEGAFVSLKDRLKAMVSTFLFELSHLMY